MTEAVCPCQRACNARTGRYIAAMSEYSVVLLPAPMIVSDALMGSILQAVADGVRYSIPRAMVAP